MTDIAKIKAPSAQSVAPASTPYLVLSELLFETAGVVDADTSGSTISVAEAGFYLVTIEAYVVGAGDQTLFLAGNGFTATTQDRITFAGDAAGISHGRAILVQAAAGANFGLQAQNSGGGAVTYLASLGVAKLAELT